MNLSAAIIAVMALPCVYNFVPNPVLVRWYWRHGQRPLPEPVERSAANWQILTIFIAQLILLAILLVLLQATPIDTADLGMHLAGLREGFHWGVALGFPWLGLYLALILVFRLRREHFSQHSSKRSSVALVGATYMSSACVEELWRAVCLVALWPHGAALAMMTTSIAFGLAHAKSVARAVSAMTFGVYMAWMFSAFETLWVPTVAHATVNIGTFVIVNRAPK